MPLRVAAYCRVSTDREDQANSLQSQQSYFRTYIENHLDWTLCDIYADEGISGTSTRHREAFNRMIADAQAGLVDLILTKEVSRFARNTVDTLEYTRKLKALGVGVIFINDNIDTRDNDGELRLTIMASIAQEESRKTSERVKWGQKRRMEAGVVFGNNQIYGFDLRNGQLTVRPDEAQVIRHIYQKVLHEGKGTHVIARELYEEGIDPPKSATGKWSCVMIRRILRNEKYVGDLLQKKSVTIDYLTHKKVENRGLEEQVLIRDHHEAIIDRPTWEAVQAELERRSQLQGDKTKFSNRYWCSGKIRCGTCGSRFVLKQTKRPNGDIYKIWGCHSRTEHGNWKRNANGEYAGCNMRMLNDKVLNACIQFVLEQLDMDYDAIAQELYTDIQHIHTTAAPTDFSTLEGKRRELEEKKVKIMDAFFSGTITRDDMITMKAKYDLDLEKLDRQIVSVQQTVQALERQRAGLDNILSTIRANVTSSQEVYREVIDQVIVYEEYIDVKVHYVPGVFRLWFSTSGKREEYAVSIDKWEYIDTTQPN